jgi:hypothetical protein
MDTLWWVVWPLVCAGGTGLVTYFVMHSRSQVLLSKQREELAAARAELAVRKETILESLKHVEDATRRQALDDFLAEIRVEERSYVREHKAFFLTRKSLIRQERIFFRNIPLSNWVEQEMPFEEGADIEKLAETMSVFAGALLEENGRPPVRKVLR